MNIYRVTVVREIEYETDVEANSETEAEEKGTD